MVKESIRNPENPTINLKNQGIKKVAELIDYEQLSPEELRESKNRNAAESAKEAYEWAAEQRRNIEIAQNGIKKGLDNEFISELTSLTLEQIQELRVETKE